MFVFVEASNPRVCLRRRGPRSLDSRAAHRNRGGLQALGDPESHDDTSSEKCLTPLHLKMKGYLPHLTETIALLREM